MTDYHTRKAQRVEEHARLHGVKMVICGACNGSGHYDHIGSPPCGSCGGIGRVRGPLNRLASDPQPVVYDWRARLIDKQRHAALKRRRHEMAS
jgi:hypothetical protein